MARKDGVYGEGSVSYPRDDVAINNKPAAAISARYFRSSIVLNLTFYEAGRSCRVVRSLPSYEKYLLKKFCKSFLPTAISRFESRILNKTSGKPYCLAPANRPPDLASRRPED
jgi:hypothetical protein